MQSFSAPAVIGGIRWSAAYGTCGLFPDPYIDAEADRTKGLRLAEHSADLDFEGVIDYYYRNTGVVPPKHARQYKRGAAGGCAPGPGGAKGLGRGWPGIAPWPTAREFAGDRLRHRSAAGGRQSALQDRGGGRHRLPLVGGRQKTVGGSRSGPTVDLRLRRGVCPFRRALSTE